jgi:hypothetical protein
MEFFMLMILPFLIAGASLLFLFICFSRGNDKSLE